MADNDYTIAAVMKALRTLKQFNSTRREMTLTELSNCCDITKSSMLRILASLEAEDFVKYDEETKKYRLGIAIFHLGNTAFEFLDIKKVALPILKSAASESQLLIHLAVLEDDEIVVIDKIWPTDNLDMVALISYVGGSVPVHCTGVGKVLAAYAGEHQREILLNRCDFKVYTERTIGDRQLFLEELEQVRRKGMAFNDGEHEPYLRCITRPIYNGEGKVVAAVSLSGLRDVIADSRLEFYNRISQKTAAAVSEELGYHRL